MVEGTMKWSSATEEFAFFTPHDGSRDVFVRFSAGERPGTTGGEHRENHPSAQVMAPTQGRPEAEPLGLAEKVEVRTRYQTGHWARGYEIADVVPSGYHVRRPGARQTLPEVFVHADVRPAGDGN